MRPHRLTMRSFRSYADETTFDFSGRTLIGVIGPIGSGKSTILDAIAFALYGQTPTEKTATKSLINQRHDSSHVELWFSVGDAVWKSVRALRRKGQSAHTLSRHDGIDGERLELIEGEKASNAKVAELLGLDFHAFGRSVLLAQNQFDSFLRASEGERDKVLKGVFGLDRLELVRDLAKQRRDAAARDLEELQRRRAEVEADRVALEAARRELEPLQALADAFESAAPLAGRVDEAVADARRNAEVAKGVVASLEETASRLPSRSETAALLAASEADAAAVEAAAAVVASSASATDAAKRRRDDVIGEVGDREALARAESAVDRLGELAAARDELKTVIAEAEARAAAASSDEETAASAVADAQARVEVAETGAQAARDAVAAAERALHEARHADMAAALAAGLNPGDDCPVCGEQVTAAPARESSDLEAAGEAVATARAAASAADAELAEANASRTTAVARHAAAKERREQAARVVDVRSQELAAAESRHTAAVTEVEKALGGEDPAAALRQRRELLDEADAALTDATTAQIAAEGKLAEAKEAATDRAKALARLANEVAALGGTLGAEIAVEADRASLESALERLREVWESRAAEAEDEVKDAARALEAANRDRAELYQRLGIEDGSDFGSARATATAAAAAVAQKVSSLSDRVSRVESLEKENEETVARHALFARLVDDLAPSRMLAFLLDEERIALSELAADRFEMLSGGRYRFSDDGAFDVLDLTAAEAVRKPRSLSGGETFLASLALALALAEMVARSGGRLEAFLLDEGFGSLDPEHLDLAMEGVERIVADDPDRLVVVVSHVGELRQRLEDVIELGKDPVTGDTRVVRA